MNFPKEYLNELLAYYLFEWEHLFTDLLPPHEFSRPLSDEILSDANN